MYKKKKIIAILIPIILLLSLSIYTTIEKPEDKPSTKNILNNPRKYENEYISGMTGKLTNYHKEDNNLILTLERFGKVYLAKCNKNVEEKLDKLKKGDTINLTGYPHLKNKGYIKAVKIERISKTRFERLFLLSYVGLALFLFLIIWDREKFFEVVSIG